MIKYSRRLLSKICRLCSLWIVLAWSARMVLPITGRYDLSYLRVFPNMVVMSPGDEKDIKPMFAFALSHTSPVAIRYPRANLDTLSERFSQLNWVRLRYSNGRQMGCFWLAALWLAVVSELPRCYKINTG